MFKKLRARWGVSGLDLFLIITTFALGGSACAQLARMVMHLSFTGNKDFFWWAAYIGLITLFWPICVMLISIPLFQYRFFSNYLKRVAGRIFLKNSKSTLYKEKVAIFASGTGSNVENFISYFSEIKNVDIQLIVCNNPKAGVVDLAQKHHLKVLLIESTDLRQPENLLQNLQNEGVTFIVLAGFLKKIPQQIITAFPNKIVNIHPALLPEFGGQGMYGTKVHEAVLQAGVSQSGITIHLVDEYYDHGTIILQEYCEIVPNETLETLRNKIQLLEKRHYPETVFKLLQNAKS